MRLTTEPTKRLEHLHRCLATFPDSVLAECYALGEPPERLPLGELVSLEDLRRDKITNPILIKFVRRLRQIRAELSEAELLELDVPLHPGDQEVYLARLGKWRFELQQLQRDSGM